MHVASLEAKSINYEKFFDIQPNRALLNHVLPYFNNLNFGYFHPRRPLTLVKKQIRNLIANQHKFDMIIIDHSFEPFYVPNQHPLEQPWHTENRELTNKLVASLHVPTLILHNDTTVDTVQQRYVPSFYFLVRDHPGNNGYCLQHATSVKKHLVSWLNNGVRDHRCHLLTKLWDKSYCNTDKFLYSFYNKQTFDPTGMQHYSETPRLDLRWLIESCSKDTVNAVADKMQEIWPNLPVEIDKHFSNVKLYDTKWFETINDVSDSKAFSECTANIVSETSIFTHMFLTEKAFKPIAMGMPIFVQHQPHTIKFLEQMGFDMYSDIINNSYDSETNYEKRMDMLVDAVDEFISIPPSISNDRILNNVNDFFSDERYSNQIQTLIQYIEEAYDDK